MTPAGSEQALSLAWALENVAGFNIEDAVLAICKVFGIDRSRWEAVIEDRSWFAGDPRWQSLKKIELEWNLKFASQTHVRLDDDVWHAPLWQLWLRNSKMVFAANLEYLIKIGGRGTTKKLAAKTKRTTTTASKWARWREEGETVRVPPTTVHPQILEFFELGATCDLADEPLFLGRRGIREALMRVEGKRYLDGLSGAHLEQAVAKLGEESARQAASRRRGES